MDRPYFRIEPFYGKLRYAKSWNTAERIAKALQSSARRRSEQSGKVYEEPISRIDFIHKDGSYSSITIPKANPHRIKLPAKWTAAKIRVDDKGQVQIAVNPSKLGSGGRFAKCVKSVEARGGAYDPFAVCAAAGRRKYGKKKFQAMAKAGKRRKAKR